MASTIQGGVKTSPWSAMRCLDLKRLIKQICPEQSEVLGCRHDNPPPNMVGGCDNLSAQGTCCTGGGSHRFTRSMHSDQVLESLLQALDRASIGYLH